MIKKGIATFTLDTGKCPRWLFERMVKLGREMVRVIVAEEGPEAFIKRMADPAWFQSLGTVLAFDWNASGLTTTLTAALKEAIRYEERELGLFICGGKGATSRKTPFQIQEWGAKLSLPALTVNNFVYNSRMAAKVDSSLIQDGFNIYHHTFFFTKSGAWTVVQQGMNQELGSARRYHWHSTNIKDLVCEPHSGISSQAKVNQVLNLTATTSSDNRELSTELVNSQGFSTLMKDFQLLAKYATPLNQMVEIGNQQQSLKFLHLENKEFHHHPVVNEDFSQSKYLQKILWKLCDEKPGSYEKLLATDGVGPKTIRGLALVAEVIYGAKASYEDPARYSFAHGGKDGTPYFVDRKTYDQNIELMKKYVKKTQIDMSEKSKIQQKLDQKIINSHPF